MPSYARIIALLAFAVAVSGTLPQTAHAAPFRSTTTIEGTYMMGATSLAEYDYWVGLYPDYAPGFAFTFYRNGNVTIYDEVGGTEYGVYSRFGRGGSRITITLTSVQSPWGTVTYELYRVGNSDDWWGEVRIDDEIYGYFRGTQD